MPESDDNLPDDPEEDGCICGLIEVHSANSWIKQAADDPDPNSLYDTLWYEGELACLFADSNLGKSILAVQIAKEIAQFQRVIYFDFELSRKQFEMRYRDEVTDKPYRFPENFDRAQINIDRYKSGDFEDMIIRSIESVAVHRKANVLIIDNLTWICNASEKGLDAGNLMIRLNTLKKTHGWSMLIVAHTPKRDLTTALTQNDLAGSKRLFNFFDSVLRWANVPTMKTCAISSSSRPATAL